MNRCPVCDGPNMLRYFQRPQMRRQNYDCSVLRYVIRRWLLGLFACIKACLTLQFLLLVVSFNECSILLSVLLVSCHEIILHSPTRHADGVRSKPSAAAFFDVNVHNTAFTLEDINAPDIRRIQAWRRSRRKREGGQEERKRKREREGGREREREGGREREGERGRGSERVRGRIKAAHDA